MHLKIAGAYSSSVKCPYDSKFAVIFLQKMESNKHAGECCYVNENKHDLERFTLELELWKKQ
jgi:hypothetical protein